MIDPQIRVGIDVGCKAHRVGIANPDGKIMEEFDISHTDAGFQDFFRRVEVYKEKLALPVAVAMEGTTVCTPVGSADSGEGIHPVQRE